MGEQNTKYFKVEGMGCMKCAAKIEKRLSEIEGVQSAKVDFPRNTLTLKGSFRDDVIIDVVAELGDYALTEIKSL